MVRTFISWPAGFADVNMKKFLAYTFLGSLPWTALILYAGLLLGQNWQKMLAVGHEASLIFVAVSAVVIGYFYLRHKRRQREQVRE